tara:strand:+ start:388 stop:705 length:318 start_codon:yes stop_codon:yes gene_type:complete
MAYYYLIAAIVFEVIGTLLLPITKNFTKPLATMIVTLSYLASFYMLTHAIKDIPLAIAYSTWSGLGIFLIAVLAYVIYNQHIQWQTQVGLIMIVFGVSIVNFYKG